MADTTLSTLMKRSLQDAWDRSTPKQVVKSEYPIMWETQDGERLFLEEMRTNHLFYSIRMLFNHTVPQGYQIPGCKTYNMDHIPIPRRTVALGYMLQELQKRPRLEEKLHKQMQYMIETAAKFAKKGIANGPARLPVR